MVWAAAVLALWLHAYFLLLSQSSTPLKLPGNMHLKASLECAGRIPLLGFCQTTNLPWVFKVQSTDLITVLPQLLPLLPKECLLSTGVHIFESRSSVWLQHIPAWASFCVDFRKTHPHFTEKHQSNLSAFCRKILFLHLLLTTKGGPHCPIAVSIYYSEECPYTHCLKTLVI